MHDVIIDGVRYTIGDTGPRIGIAISTRNRNELVAQAIEAHRRFLPPNAVLVVVDDASQKPVDGADYRFEHRAGIPAVKNKSIELLMDAGCDYLSLWDDDTTPIADHWWEPYAASPEPHLAYGFTKVKNVRGELGVERIIHQDDHHTAYSGQRGCMLWYQRRAIEACGGMDPVYGMGMYEHSDLANRIHHAGLTTWRYADITGSNKLIRSLDEENQVERSVSLAEREQQVKTNVKIHHHRRDTWHQAYVDYRQPGANVVATTLLTGGTAKQQDVDKRNYRPDVKLLADLAASVTHGRLVVFHDQLRDPKLVDGAGHDVEFIQVGSPQINVFFARHQIIWSWLRDHPEVGKVWCVDGTDVKQLRDPFTDLELGKLYVGWEPKIVADPWMINRHKESRVAQAIRDHGREQLLNAGLIGGDRSTVLGFLHQLYAYAYDVQMVGGRLDQGDMGQLQRLAYGRFADRLVTGSQVATVFKSFQSNEYSWWQHK